MSLKYKPLPKKQIDKPDPLKQSLDEAFEAVGSELQKLRDNPIIKFFNSLSKEEAENLINKLKNL